MMEEKMPRICQHADHDFDNTPAGISKQTDYLGEGNPFAHILEYRGHLISLTNSDRVYFTQFPEIRLL
jgi:hypothetical protein